MKSCFCTTVLCVGMILACTGPATAELSAVITPGTNPATGSVWTFSGNGVLTIGTPAGASSPELEALGNLGNQDAWQDLGEYTAVNDLEGAIISGSGSITVNATVYVMGTPYIDHDTGVGVDDFGVGIVGPIANVFLAHNDAISWTGTIETNVPYNDLAPGVYGVSQYGRDTNASLPLTLTIVPEPTSMALLSLGGLMLLRRRRVA